MKIVRRNNLIQVVPWAPVLEAPLTFQRRSKQKEWPYRLKMIPEYLYVKDEDGTGYIHGGLFRRVERILRAHRIPFEVVDERGKLPVPRFDRLGALREKQDVVLAAVCSSHGGIIKCPTGWGKTYLICQLPRLYPGHKILVLTPRQPVVKSIYERMCEGEEDSDDPLKISAVYAGRTYMPESDIIVCCTSSIHRIDSEWPDIIIFDEVHGSGTDKIRMGMMHFSASRLFGFSATPEGRHDDADLQTEALFGELICDISYKEAQADGTVPAIQVRVVKVACDEITFKTDSAKERSGYWRNAYRNDLIVAAANCPEFEGQQMLILVKTVEHAIILHNQLRDFALVYGGLNKQRLANLIEWGILDITGYNTQENALAYQEYAEDMQTRIDQGEEDLQVISYGDYLLNLVHKVWKKVDVAQMEEDFRAGKVRRVIATTIWREGVDFPDLPIVIRADGMSGVIASLQMAGRLCRLSEHQKILIDFEDDFGYVYYRRYQERIKHYESQGWEVLHDWRP